MLVRNNANYFVLSQSIQTSVVLNEKFSIRQKNKGLQLIEIKDIYVFTQNYACVEIISSYLILIFFNENTNSTLYYMCSFFGL